jgi:predicted nucleic acid-binding protein
LKFYLDSSFIVEVVKGEARALEILANLDGNLYTSQLGRLEVLRTFNRFYSDWLPYAYEFLSTINLVNLDGYVLNAVENYGEAITLTTADAIHVSSAQSLLEGNDSLVTFDKEMAKNAKKMGLLVISS